MHTLLRKGCSCLAVKRWYDFAEIGDYLGNIGSKSSQDRSSKENETMNNHRLRAVGINHVALEVGDIDEALEFYGKLFDLDLLSRSETGAFIGLGE